MKIGRVAAGMSVGNPRCSQDPLHDRQLVNQRHQAEPPGKADFTAGVN